MPPSTLDDVVYIKELSFNFSDGAANTNEIPVVLDATVEYSKKYSAELTTHPVSDNTNRADNYRVDPPTISFSGVISDLDAGLYDWAFNSINLAVRSGGEVGVLNRAQQYVERLENILRNRKLVEIRIPNGLTTTNCMITSLDISRKQKTGDAFEVSIEARQIDFVTSRIINNPMLDSLTEEKNVGASTTISPRLLDLTRVQAEDIMNDTDKSINSKIPATEKIKEDS